MMSFITSAANSSQVACCTIPNSDRRFVRERGAVAKRSPDRRVHRTRKALQDAMISMIIEKGYDATTVQDIVERSNFSRSTFFRYFRSKDDPVFWDLPERAELMGVRLANLSCYDHSQKRR